MGWRESGVGRGGGGRERLKETGTVQQERWGRWLIEADVFQLHGTIPLSSLVVALSVLCRLLDIKVSGWAAKKSCESTSTTTSRPCPFSSRLENYFGIETIRPFSNSKQQKIPHDPKAASSNTHTLTDTDRKTRPEQNNKTTKKTTFQNVIRLGWPVKLNRSDRFPSTIFLNSWMDIHLNFIPSKSQSKKGFWKKATLFIWRKANIESVKSTNLVIDSQRLEKCRIGMKGQTGLW